MPVRLGLGWRTATLLLAAASGPLCAQTTASPQELVRKTVWNEVKSANDPSDAKFFFRSKKSSPQGTQTKLYVETKDATAGLVIALNGKPLNPEQQRAEEERIERFVNDPSELRKKRKQEREDAEHTLQIVRALPDALLFEADGTESGTQGVGKPGDELVRLKFRPNPDYFPPSHVEQVLTGMQGIVLIDSNQHRIAKIDGTLFKEVGFGWGILGHLDKGSHFLVVQADLGNGYWDVTHMSLNFTGKVLLFRNLKIQSDEVFSDFRPVAKNLTFAQGVDLLKKQESELAENHQRDGGGEK
jgi:hypothetical protein